MLGVSAGVTPGLAACSSEGARHVAAAVDISQSRVVATSTDSLDVLPIVPAHARSGVDVFVLQQRDGFVLRLMEDVRVRQELFVRRGRGPGELEQIQSVAFDSTNTLWVLDGSLQLHAFRSAPTLHFERTMALPYPTMGRLTAAGLLSDAMRFNDSLRPPELISFQGASHRFGVAVRYGGDRQLSTVALAKGGGLWSARLTSYSLSQLDASGTVVRSIQCARAWFPDHEGNHAMPWVSRPKPMIRDVADLGGDRVAVLITRAAPDWRPSAPPLPSSNGPLTIGALTRIDAEKLFEHLIEIVSARDGSLLATSVVRGRPLGFTGNAHLAVLDEQENHGLALRLLPVR